MKRTFRMLRLAAALAAATGCAAAFAAAPPAPSAPPGAAASSGNVVRATLRNGLQVVIVRNAFAPVVSQQITYFVGGNQAPPGFPGIAHAQEHMMFRGAPGLTKDQLAAIIARLGGNMNATTSNDRTNFLFTAPKDDLDVVLHVGALRMAGVNDFQSEWEKERGAIEQEVAMDNSSAIRKLLMDAEAHLFAGTPYQYDALGTTPSFNKLTGAQLLAFHNTWYAPDNALLVVTGDLDPAATLAKIKELYGKIPSRKIPAKATFKFQPVHPGTYSAPNDEPFGFVAIAFRMPGYRSADHYVANLATAALSSQRGPLQALQFEGKVLAAGFLPDTDEYTGMGLAYAVYPPGGDPQKVRQELVSALTIARAGVAPDIITAAQRRAELDLQLQRNSEEIFGGLSGAWSHAIGMEGLQSPEEAYRRLAAVTPAQVNAFLADRIDLAHSITLVAKPVAGAKPHPLAQTTHENLSTAPSGPVTLPAWAAKTFAALPHPTASLHPVDMRLANGLHLIVQPLHNSDSVSLYGEVHENEGLQAPKGEEGVSGLLDSLFAYGPQGTTREAFETEVGKLGAELAAGSSFSLKVLPGHFAAGAKLLAANLLDPALPETAFRQQQAIAARQAAGQVTSPAYKFSRAVDKALWPAGDPALRHPTAKSIESLTRAELVGYYHKVFRPDETTIVVAGDITPAEAKAVIEQDFGGWQASGTKPDLADPATVASTPTHMFVPDPLRKQDEVFLSETVACPRTNPDHFALKLADRYLSGGFYGTALYREVREHLGLVYTIESGFNFQRNRADFQIFYGSYPDKVGAARTASVAVLHNVVANGLTPADLNLAKSVGLQHLELAQQSVGSIARNWIRYSEDGEPLDWNYVTARRYEQLTGPEVQAALTKYVNPERLSTVVLGQPIAG